MSSNAQLAPPENTSLAKKMAEGVKRTERYATYSRTGLSINIDPKLPEAKRWEQWLQIGETVQGIGNAYPWYVGDWLAYGEAAFGEKYTQAIASTSYDPDYLRQLNFVSSNVPQEIRREELSHKHHRMVASPSLTLEEKKRFLDLAVQGKEIEGGGRRLLTTREVAQEIINEKKGAQPKAPMAAPYVTFRPVFEAMKMGEDMGEYEARLRANMDGAIKRHLDPEARKEWEAQEELKKQQAQVDKKNKSKNEKQRKKIAEFITGGNVSVVYRERIQAFADAQTVPSLKAVKAELSRLKAEDKKADSTKAAKRGRAKGSKAALEGEAAKGAQAQDPAQMSLTEDRGDTVVTPDESQEPAAPAPKKAPAKKAGGKK